MMELRVPFILSFLTLIVTASSTPRAADPCAVIGGQKWVAPSAVRACFESFPINESTKSNVCHSRFIA